jgi:hypothetical protein
VILNAAYVGSGTIDRLGYQPSRSRPNSVVPNRVSDRSWCFSEVP